MFRLVLLLLTAATIALAANNLEIYVIDVEGGKSVLFISPSGQSMLIDAGWPSGLNNIPPSADRIAEVAHTAGLKRIDHVVISHFDLDHLGDIPALASKIPLGHLYDHGQIVTTPSNAERAQQRFTPYAAFRGKTSHTNVKPGDTIPFQGVNVQVVAAGGRSISKPLPGAGAPNNLCATNKQRDPLASDVEDDQSIGLVIAYGKFRMLDLADLEAHNAHDLVCPNNLLGTFSVYNANVHGQFKGIAPELVGAVKAPVIIQANGARKGADAQTWPVLSAAPMPHDIWQLHFSENAGKDANPSDHFVVNPAGPDGFHPLRISAASDGSFTVTNTRNNFSKHYSH